MDKSEQYTNHANKQIKCTDQTWTFHSQRPPYDYNNIQNYEHLGNYSYLPHFPIQTATTMMPVNVFYRIKSFDIHRAVHPNIISIVKPTRCTDVSNLFYFGMTLYMFQTVFPSIIRSSILYIQQQAFVTAVSVWLMPIAVCTVLNSWWWTERPSETCRV